MERLTRKQQKIFAESATNNGVFGSLQGNDPTISSDPDVLQGRPAYSQGWNDATYSAELLPPLEEFQGLQYLFSRQLAYVFQEGISEWDIATTYYVGSIVKSISGTRIYIYLSIADNNTGNNVGDSTKWKLLYDSEFGYADVNLSNITSTGKNISNWSSNVTNCITEIPQDIKLELSAGVLTLKAGSKIYVPNGAGVFDTVTTSSDLTWTGGWGSQQFFVYLAPNNNLAIREVSITESGSSSTLTGQYRCWYDTTNKRVKWTDDYGSNWTDGYSFPIALVTSDASSVISIDQVFNGFGYIGSTVFALPSVKGLIPNGRNTDGTLKNIELVNQTILTFNWSPGLTGNGFPITLSQYGMSFWGNTTTFYDGDRPLNPSDWTRWYNTQDNFWEVYVSGWSVTPEFIVGNVDLSDGKVTSFNAKPVFRSIDYSDAIKYYSDAIKYSDKETVVGWCMPNYSAGVSKSVGTTYTETQNGYLYITVQDGNVARLDIYVNSSLIGNVGTLPS